MKMRPGVRFWLPAAAMDEADLREEIRGLARRGFGRIEAVVLGFQLPKIGKDEEWGSEKWNHMMEILSDEAGKHGMYLDITNGPEWPISSPVIQSADEDGTLYELTYGALDFEGGRYTGRLPQARMIHEEGTEKLLSVMAYRKKKEKTLIRDSYIDLMPFVQKDGTLCVELPRSGEGWKIFAFYEQPAAQRIKRGGTYVIDHLSRAGIRACETYWDGVIPHLSLDSMEAFFCDSLEYDVALEWTRELEQEFEQRRGYSLLPYLPVIGISNTYPLTDIPGYQFEETEISDMINRDYLEVITQLHCENHLAPLQEMAEKYGKTVRYQVAYNRPYEVDRCGLYVGIPENEALGRAAMDLQKNMAAAAHLGRKERYSFECAAEFGHSYGQDYENLMWWVKRSLMSGMNAQVLHGASYSGKYTGETSVNGALPGTVWPGYEAFGKLVSNYWNRTPSEEHARGVLDTITRMNMVCSKTAKIDCAVLSGRYGSDGLGSEFCLYEDDGILCNYGYSYEFVSEALLDLPVCRVKNRVLDEEGPAYRCLIIDTVHPLSTAFLQKINGFAKEGLPVVFVGEKPAFGKFYSDWNTKEKQERWEQALEEAWKQKTVLHVSDRMQVPQMLMEHGISPRIEVNGKERREDVMTAVRKDEASGITYYLLYRYNRAVCTPDDPNPDAVSVSAIYRKGTVKGSYQRLGKVSERLIKADIHNRGRVLLCNPWDGTEKELPVQEKDGRLHLEISMEEDELVMLAVVPKEAEKAVGLHQDTVIRTVKDRQAITFSSLCLYPFVPDTEGENSFLRSSFSKEGEYHTLENPRPWRYLNPKLEHFSGKGIYEGNIFIEHPDPDAEYILQLGNVCDTFTVLVNGNRTPYPDQVMKRADLTGLLKEGNNTLQIEVVSNLYNALFHENVYVGNDKMPYLPRDYGIWEEEGREICLLKCFPEM